MDTPGGRPDLQQRMGSGHPGHPPVPMSHPAYTNGISDTGLPKELPLDGVKDAALNSILLN